MNKDIYSLVLKRWGLIENLREGAKDKRTVVESVNCSRSTVNRAIRELESMGVVEYTDGKYAITSLGESIAGGFENMAESVETRLELEPFLQWVPEEEFDIDLRHLQDAELWVPEPGDPWAMVNRHVRVLEQTDDMRCVLPLVGLHGHETAHDQIVDNGARAEMISTPDVTHTLQANPAYAELTEEMAATGRFDLFQYEGPIPYFVGLLDDLVQVGADEDGEPRALLETDNPIARNWAENKVKEYKRRAEPVEIAPGLPSIWS